MPAPAQRVLGVGDDALVLPRGVFRFRTLAQWTSFNERYGMNTPGRPNGALEPLGVDFTLDTIGVKQFPNLDSLQFGLQQLTGDPNWYATLGNTHVDLRDRVTAYPFIFEAGISRKFSLGIQIPYVVTHSMTFFNVNTTGIQGNLGFNPALAPIATAVTQNTNFFAQFTTAANTLQGSLDACANPPASATPECVGLNANRASAQSLVDNSRAFAGGVNKIYTTSPFVPIVGTDAQLSIEARTAAFRALYQQFGVNSILATTTGPFASQNRLTLRDAQRILSDTAFGIIADPLTSTSHAHIGDIDIGGKFSVFDSFGGNAEARMSPHGLNFRTAVGGIFRIPTGQIESPNNFIDVGTGRGAKAVEGRWFGDLLVGSRFWQSFIVRFNKPFADDQEMRIIDLPNQELAPIYRRQTVRRQLGSAFEFETTPRIVINDFFSISGQYVYRHKGPGSLHWHLHDPRVGNGIRQHHPRCVDTRPGDGDQRASARRRRLLLQPLLFRPGKGESPLRGHLPPLADRERVGRESAEVLHRSDPAASLRENVRRKMIAPLAEEPAQWPALFFMLERWRSRAAPSRARD